MYKSNINLNLYKTFYEVAKYGSISKAAEKNFISQPAVSKAIKKLENDLNCELVFRNIKGITLTEKGKTLLFYIERAYNNFLIAERIMLEDESLEKGKLSIGVPSQIGSFYLFNNILNFHKEYPNIEITIISKSTEQLLTLLESHEIDFIIDTSPIFTKLNDVCIVPLKKVKNCFVKNKNLKINKPVESLKDLEDLPLILPIKGTSNRINLDKLLEENNVDISNVINIHTSEMIISAIKENLGIGYIIYDLIKDNKDFEIIELKEKLPTITINLVYIKNYLTKAPIYFIKKYINSNINI